MDPLVVQTVVDSLFEVLRRDYGDEVPGFREAIDVIAQAADLVAADVLKLAEEKLRKRGV